MATENIETYENGVLIETRTVDIPPEALNQRTIEGALDSAISYFANAYTNWPSFTAAQKDAANRNAMRALVRILRVLRNRYEADA